MPLQDAICKAIQEATDFSKRIVKTDGHWLGPMSSNVTPTAEWIFLLQSIGRPIEEVHRQQYVHHFLSSQQDDGSWPIAPRYPHGGDISATIEAYLALKILGLTKVHPAMLLARNFILCSGGAEKMRVFTRFHFAMFGLIPWSCVPQMPPELIYLPSWCPINLYRFSSWARIAIVPFSIIRTNEPTYPLPNGCRRNNDYVDELWLVPSLKSVPYTKSIVVLLLTDIVAAFFQIADVLIGFTVWLGIVPWRKRALRDCAHWLLDHQEISGDWAGFFAAMHVSIYALLLDGHVQESSAIQRGMAALDRFVYYTPKLGKWMQPCVSPVWDTFLMTRGLADCGRVSDDTPSLVTRGLDWARLKQILIRDGDWRINRPDLEPGGFSFEYANTQYPDVDDTAAGVLAFLVADPSSIKSSHVTRAAVWILGMQNADGGWAAFDVNNDATWLNSIPFSDMDALCDESCADIVGRVLEALGLMLQIHSGSAEGKAMLDYELLNTIKISCAKGIDYLARTQESSGSWFGRWGVNYIYGTSNVLCGLAYFSSSPKVSFMAERATRWLESIQNQDGGWGETTESYVVARKAGRGPSTPSQTAWAVMGLLPFRSATDTCVQEGMQWLLARQNHVGDEAGTWDQELYTGTGFPGKFYLGYDLYRHYFPLMALGRYMQALKANDNT